MAYEVLARKWRPDRFSRMVGQEHVLRALVHALEQDRLHHAYLFTGTRGVGKTTVARILARCLNCEQGVGPEPCGTCASCTEITEGRFVDLIEVDAASRTKVEDTREILDNVPYAPTRGRYKIYLIDEVHMLSTSSFNALLKTLEEPPSHVKFLLATTDPKKLPVTVLSRCLQFHLKNLSPERITAYLEQVLGAEQIEFEMPALHALARAADGSMRDALSLTDQAIGDGEGSLGADTVARMLGTIDQDALKRILTGLAEGDGDALIACCEDLAMGAADFTEVLKELMRAFHHMARQQALPDRVAQDGGDEDPCVAMAGRMAPEDVQLYYQIALMGLRDLSWAPDVRTGFEMTLLRMLSFCPLAVTDAPGGTGHVDQTGAPAPASSAVRLPAEDSRAGHDKAPGPDAIAPQPESQPEQRPESQPESQPKPQAKSQPESRSEPQPESQPKSQPEPQAEQQPEPQAKPQPKSQPESRAKSQPEPQPESQPEPQPESQPEPQPESQAKSQPEPQAKPQPESQPQPQPEPQAKSQSEQQPEQQPEPQPEQQPEPQPERPAPDKPLQLRCPEDWPGVLATLALDRLTREAVAHCSPTRISAGRLELTISTTAADLFGALQEHAAHLGSSLSAQLGSPWQVHITPGEPGSETPAQQEEKAEQERQGQAVEAIRNDAGVRLLQERFNASLQHESIRPL